MRSLAHFSPACQNRKEDIFCPRRQAIDSPLSPYFYPGDNPSWKENTPLGSMIAAIAAGSFKRNPPKITGTDVPDQLGRMKRMFDTSDKSKQFTLNFFCRSGLDVVHGRFDPEPNNCLLICVRPGRSDSAFVVGLDSCVTADC